ncbi:hypothetical protein YC2023_014080 [Brassica napus]
MVHGHILTIRKFIFAFKPETKGESTERPHKCHARKLLNLCKSTYCHSLYFSPKPNPKVDYPMGRISIKNALKDKPGKERERRMSNSRAATTVNTWSGFTFMLPLFSAPFADSYWDRFFTILASSSLYFVINEETDNDSGFFFGEVRALDRTYLPNHICEFKYQL